MNPVKKAFLLAAGLGTRLRPLTDRVPKCLVPVRGKPLCDYWFSLCERHGIEDVLMNTHHLAGVVRKHVASRNGRIRIHLAHEETLLGSAGTVRENAAFVAGEDAFLVIYADNLSNADLGALVRFHESHGAPITIGLFNAPAPRHCGIASLDADGRVVEFVEKPEHPKSDLANAGLYVVDSSVLVGIPNDKPVVDFGHDILPRYVGRMFGFPLNCFHLDIGTPENYAKAEATYPD